MPFDDSFKADFEGTFKGTASMEDMVEYALTSGYVKARSQNVW